MPIPLIGAIGAVLGNIVTSTIKSYLPDTPDQVIQKIELSIKQQTLENDLLKGQLAINVEEAKNENIFVSGWRPAVG
jgi:hypothetical protein